MARVFCFSLLRSSTNDLKGGSQSGLRRCAQGPTLLSAGGSEGNYCFSRFFLKSYTATHTRLVLVLVMIISQGFYMWNVIDWMMTLNLSLLKKQKEQKQKNKIHLSSFHQSLALSKEPIQLVFKSMVIQKLVQLCASLH